MTGPDPVGEVRALMRAHGLTRDRVAAILGVAPSTVDSWLAPPGASSYRAMPARYATFLALSVSDLED